MNFHFKYSGECKITADTYEEAKKQLTHMLLGIYSYHQIHPTCSMLATPDEFYTDEDDEFILDDGV